MIYLDYNATAPMLPSVKDAMASLLGEPLNASSVHAGGRKAKKLLEDARRDIAQALGAFPNEVLFTASGSEANNMVLRAFKDRPLLVSAIEHASIAKTGKLLGAAVIPVDENGVVQREALASQLAALGKPALVSIMLANNETGVIQPIAELSEIVHQHDGLLHVDAVQGLGKITVDWGLLKADMLTISSHKVGGPLGAAALLIRADLPIQPLITGGGQELGRRAGTEDIAAIHGFATAVKEVASCADAKRQLLLRKVLETSIRSAAPNARQYVFTAPQLPNTLMLAMPGVSAETQLMYFDLSGIAVSAGSACSSGRIEPSSVLLAMGVKSEEAATAIRISLGWGTTEEEIHNFVEIWKTAFDKLSKGQAA